MTPSTHIITLGFHSAERCAPQAVQFECHDGALIVGNLKHVRLFAHADLPTHSRNGAPRDKGTNGEKIIAEGCEAVSIVLLPIVMHEFVAEKGLETLECAAVLQSSDAINQLCWDNLVL